MVQLTRDLAGSFRAAIEGAGLALEVSCDPIPAGEVYLDPGLWDTIVLNLLSNALKFTFDGGITVLLADRGDRVELTVADTGIGIPAESASRLFERFYRVQGARARTMEGSGIGLALVRELAELHGGSVRVESEVGRGSTFTVSVPKGSAHLAPERIVAEPTPGAGPRAYLAEAERWSVPAGSAAPDGPAGDGLGRVLIVDDNADLREYLARVLAPVARVEAARDGVEALEAARRERPDLVVTDVMMPRLDGFGLLRAIREDLALRELPVIVLSARAGDEARVDGLRAGADDYLVKPFSAAELLARVRTQLELGRARRTASLDGARLRSLLASVPAAINFLRGPDLVFEFVHPWTAARLGRDARGLPLVEAAPHRGQTPFPDLLRRVYETGEPSVGVEAPLRLDGREESWWNFVYAPVRAADGAVEGVMTFELEVTDQVLLRRKLEDARAEAEAANRAKDEFLAVLGHELRNPLAPIVTALQVMEMSGDAFPLERAVIGRQLRHVVRLVDDLLDLSRLTRGKLQLQRSSVELRAIVGHAVEIASPLLEAKSHRLVLDVPDGLVVDADPGRLAQAAANLLTNAAKYTPDGGQIQVRGRRRSGRIELVVEDDGVGIEPSMLPRVFERFVQGRQPIDRSEGGLGLGLTIVRSLIELHGGQVWARSDGPGRGSAFGIVVPPARARRPESRAPEPVQRRSHRILVVDDNQDAADLLVQALTLRGHQVRSAYDAVRAEAVLATFAPEIALLDLGLPVVDGFELARRLRTRLGRVRLVALTGYGQATDRALALAAGFDEHLVKPVDLAALEQALFPPE